MTVRVLIVDDQEPFRLAARMVVEITDGFEVVGEAETGEDSVRMASELRPDLVLMDVNLPGINGLDATRQILGQGGDSVVVLLLSTYEEEEYAPRAAAGLSGVEAARAALAEDFNLNTRLLLEQAFLRLSELAA